MMSRLDSVGNEVGKSGKREIGKAETEEKQKAGKRKVQAQRPPRSERAGAALNS